jgi:hypothetical protein
MIPQSSRPSLGLCSKLCSSSPGSSGRHYRHRLARAAAGESFVLMFRSRAPGSANHSRTLTVPLIEPDEANV